MLAEHDVPRHLAGLARRAARLCPTLALSLEASDAERRLPAGGAPPLAAGERRR